MMSLIWKLSLLRSVLYWKFYNTCDKVPHMYTQQQYSVDKGDRLNIQKNLRSQLSRSCYSISVVTVATV